VAGDDVDPVSDDHCDHDDPELATHYEGTASVCDRCGEVVGGCATPLRPGE